jgi:membrane-bound lytic murein transglycosylase D
MPDRRVRVYIAIGLFPLAAAWGSTLHAQVPGPTRVAESVAAEPAIWEGALATLQQVAADDTAKTAAQSADDLTLAPSAEDPLTPQGLQGSVQVDLKRGGLDIPTPLNRRVLAYIDLFQGRLHDFIEEGMKRGSRYLPMIQGVLRAEGLPLDLAYVPLVESAFKPNALSKASAKGVWQFMKGTALENGLRHDWYIDERSDPEKATVAAANYLKTLANLFDGDWHLALASYNGGPGRLQKAIKRVGVNDFWALAGKPKVLPRETREYVPMILAAIVIARNPAQYGFSFEPEQEPAFDTVMLGRGVGRYDDRIDPGAQSRASPLDHPGQRRAV